MKSSQLPYAIRLAIVLVTIALAGSDLMVPNALAGEEISIATLEYAPFTGKNLRFNGFVNHVIAESFKRKGHAVKFV